MENNFPQKKGKPSTGVQTVVKENGASEDGTVEVDISYDIIRQFSAQLYTNPRKAIEELVCNSYDAGAKVCHVSLPKNENGSLMILDNGKSMNLRGLQDLWRVASSPKYQGEDKERIDNNRMQIGKFGVGKLAAFALGERLTHVACVNNDVRVVSVGQSELKDKKGAPPKFKVYRLPIQQAIPLLEPYLSALPKPWHEGWPTWTLAIVEQIDQPVSGRALSISILRRMITNALPISADFRVYVEGNEVPKKEIKDEDIAIKVEITNPELKKNIRDELQAFWLDAGEGATLREVPKELYELRIQKVANPQKTNEYVDALIVPRLGPVIGNSIMTYKFLTTEKLSERGYANNGFAIRAHGKLINPENELFGISARSHSYWARFLANLEMPGLDRVLLVQRNDVSENSNEAQIARLVAKVVFNFTRVKYDEKFKEEAAYSPESFGIRLRTLSPIAAPIALSGLSEGEVLEKGLDSLEVGFSSFGESGPAVRYDPVEKKILVNEDHPLIEALDDLGQHQKANLRQVVAEVLAGTQMAKGYLRSQSIPEKVVQDTGDIIEVSVRSAAQFVVDEVKEHIDAIEEASYVGGKPLENAVVTAFRSLRLVASRYGASDEPDGIIEIPKSGAPNLRISVEAKGSRGVINHEDL